MAETSCSSLHPYALPKVIGISLIVTAGDDPSRTLTFLKSSTPVINIGRLPSTKLPRTEVGVNDTAWFKCAVVSRKHAKIFFADSGQGCFSLFHACPWKVYLVDLCSHHGTQVLKPGETIFKKIEPESPTSLNDGDVVTFGKSVGRDIDVVRPVSTRVKFVLQSRSSPKHQPADLADESLEFPYKPHPTRKSSTGRYGVANSSASSSSSSSDIEEVGGPEILSIRPPEHEEHEGRSRGIELLKHILPPIRFPTSPSRSSSIPSAAYDPLNAELATKHVISLLSDNHSDVSTPPSPVVTGPDHSNYECNYNGILETEPSVVGAWPTSPISPISQAESPILMWEPIMFPEVIEVVDESREGSYVENQDNNIPTEASLEVPISDQRVDETKRSQSPFPFESDDAHSQHSESRSGSVKGDEVAKPVDVGDGLRDEVSKIKDTVDQVFTDVQLLRYSKRKAASHIHKAEKKLQTLETRLTRIDTLCASNADCISDMIESEFSRINTTVSRQVEDEKRDAALGELLQEMKTFREDTTKQISEEIESLKAAREDALHTIKDMTAQMQHLQTSSASLKRKRSDDAEDEDRADEDRSLSRIKRSRKHVVSKILQTAGVFTFGAAATWSALAFT